MVYIKFKVGVLYEFKVKKFIFQKMVVLALYRLKKRIFCSFLSNFVIYRSYKTTIYREVTIDY